jgi:phage tail sheath protein FI
MAVYLSPGVYLNEIDLSVLPTAVGSLTPAFFGAANKGPMNKPTLILSAADYINTFGEPFPESYLGYAVLAYMEEGNRCFVTRVGVECVPGQPAELNSVCIDTTGTQGAGWGRIPLFQGIDYGRINLRPIDDAHPLIFHAASTTTPIYHEATVGSTHGPASASLTITGTYNGSVNDNFTLLITGAPDVSANSAIGGATFQVMRGSDGAIIASGILSGDGTSAPIILPNGLTLVINVTAGVLGVNDVFTWTAQPDNRQFIVGVEGVQGGAHTMPATTYKDAPSFVAALNALLGGEQYTAVVYTLPDGTIVPQLQTLVAGRWLQLLGSAAFAATVGQVQYIYDIPRAYLAGTDAPPNGYSISSANNRVVINIIDAFETQQVAFTLPSGINLTPAQLAANINGAGGVLFSSSVITAPGGGQRVLIITTQAEELAFMQMLANYTHMATLRFAEMLGIPYPYQRGYRGFQDSRPQLPLGSTFDPATPASCDVDPASAQCTIDLSYYQNIVGWLVATSAGTWINNVTANLTIFTQGIGEVAGRYTLVIKDSNNLIVSRVDDISFDATADRYIGNVINPGSKFGGFSGDPFFNWVPRPAYLNFDPTQGDNSTNPYMVRQPSVFAGVHAVGGANGIPTDPAFSSELDMAVMGNPALSTGIYAMQNPESYDINLLITPGFSSGAVIGQCLQMCEARGDVLYLVDPPFGLRAQQVVDWHNGMLVSDLSTAINSSYGALYWSWIKIFDSFNNIQIWVPPSGQISAVFSRTARLTDMWYAPAGLNRGRLPTALELEYSPSQSERDLLYGYGNAVNPIVNFPRDGIIVWGQRTLQRKASALDRVNVRMLLIYLKKNLSAMMRGFLFEPNDTTLWSQVLTVINPFLADIQSRRGLTAYKVVCDATNNTPERIDRNELWVSVFIQPTRAVEFVVLNLVVIQTGASFSAQEILAAGGVVVS